MIDSFLSELGASVEFWLLFLIINIGSFLPNYLLNFREQPNPLSFLFVRARHNQSKRRLLLVKVNFSDPFRINSDFSIFLLLSILLLGGAPEAKVFSTALLGMTFVYQTYIAIMLYIFNRSPVLLSDWLLLKSGWQFWRESRMLIIALATLLLAAIFLLAKLTVELLVSFHPGPNWMIAVVLGGIVFFTTYHFDRGVNHAYHFRTFSSCAMHILRSIKHSSRYQELLEKDRSFFREKSPIKSLSLSNRPHMVFLCVESYGSITHKNPTISEPLFELFDQKLPALESQGYGVASTLSAAPIFAGGSWLSYSSFMYGIRIDNLQVYDILFETNSNFEDYQSTFHLLKKAGYCNVFMCPLGGSCNQDVNWEALARFSQADLLIDWDTLGYKGKTVPIFAQRGVYSAPDQFVVNRGFELAKEFSANQGNKPICSFYCTTNSHVPYISPLEVLDDWRDIETSAYEDTNTLGGSERYNCAIRYQLEVALDFLLAQSEDTVLVIFGDHQPPAIATPQHGFDTPVHVISKNSRLTETLQNNGMVAGMNLANHIGQAKHESFMSLLLSSLDNAYGRANSKVVILADGVDLYS